MIITNTTTTWQIAELMGDQADDMDGRIMLSLLAAEDECDTDAIPDDKWNAMLDQVAQIRREDDAEADADSAVALSSNDWDYGQE